MLIAGSLAMTVWLATTVGFPSLQGLSIGLILINGISTTVMTLLLYLGLARGPVSVVAPIVAAHPVLVVVYYAVLNTVLPPNLQLVAIAVTIAGTLLVAWKAPETPSDLAKAPVANALSTTILIATGSSCAYAVLIIAGQAAAEHHGQFHTLWLGRLVSLSFLLLLFLARRRAPNIPYKWWPFLTMQGLLDAGGYIALFAGGIGSGKEIVTVVAGTFGAVTVLLAWVILREKIARLQWLGIILVFAGVMVLSGNG